MKYLSKKDWAIIVLFFVFVLAVTSFAVFMFRFDETPYESIMGHIPAASFFVGIGFILLRPLFMLTAWLFFPFAGFWQLIPWLAAILYTVFLALGLAMYNDRNNLMKGKY